MESNWLKQRSEILAKYAESLPTRQDRIKITFENPEAGWMPIHFFKNEQEAGRDLYFSDVYDSFVPLREWLETIATIGHEKASIVNLDCEGQHISLYYEPVWHYDFENYKGKLCPPCCGIFSVYDSYEDRFILDAFCNTETFVRDVYKCIIDFAKAMKDSPKFVEEWDCFRWSNDHVSSENEETWKDAILLKKMKSPSIEAYIRNCDSWHKNRNYFKRKERKNRSLKKGGLYENKSK